MSSFVRLWISMCMRVQRLQNLGIGWIVFRKVQYGIWLLNNQQICTSAFSWFVLKETTQQYGTKPGLQRLPL